MAICNHCEGKGKYICFRCGGKGYTTELSTVRATRLKVPTYQEELCFECGGCGNIKCSYCNGTGKSDK